MEYKRRCIKLYEDDHVYEEEYVDAVLYRNKLSVHAVTSEKGEGSTYGTGYALDEENTIKLENTLGTDENGLLIILNEKFSGCTAEKAFCGFCDKNDIKYERYLV